MPLSPARVISTRTSGSYTTLMRKAWDVEARINLALPMDDRTAVDDAVDSRNRQGGAG